MNKGTTDAADTTDAIDPTTTTNTIDPSLAGIFACKPVREGIPANGGCITDLKF